MEGSVELEIGRSTSDAVLYASERSGRFSIPWRRLQAALPT